MMHILKLLKFLAYVFATAVVAMVLALVYWMIPVAILDLVSQKPALVVFYQVTGIVAAEIKASLGIEFHCYAPDGTQWLA